MNLNALQPAIKGIEIPQDSEKRIGHHIHNQAPLATRFAQQGNVGGVAQAILGGGDAVAGPPFLHLIQTPQFLRQAGLGNQGHEWQARRFLQHPVGFARGGIALDLAAGRIRGGFADFHQGQGGAVGHHQVAGGVHHQDRHRGTHRIEIGPGGVAAFYQQAVVVADEELQLAGWGGMGGQVGANRRLQFRDAAGLSHRRRTQIGPAPGGHIVGKVAVGINETRQ